MTSPFVAQDRVVTHPTHDPTGDETPILPFNSGSARQSVSRSASAAVGGLGQRLNRTDPERGHAVGREQQPIFNRSFDGRMESKEHLLERYAEHRRSSAAKRLTPADRLQSRVMVLAQSGVDWTMLGGAERRGCDCSISAPTSADSMTRPNAAASV